MYLYRHILKQAGQITWKHKFLWFFGFFAALLGSFGGYEILVNRSNTEFARNSLQKIQRLKELGLLQGEFFNNVFLNFKANPIATAISLIILLLLLGLFIFLVWLAVTSQVALVSNTAQISKGENNYSNLNINAGIKKGTEKFWQVLGINVLSKAIIYLIFFGLSLLLLWGVSFYSQSLINSLYVILFIIFMPAALLIAFILKYSICYIVLEDKNFLDSVKKGWYLFLRNWLITLEIALILFAVTFVATLAIIAVSLVAGIPLLFLLELLTYLSPALSFWFLVIIFLVIAVIMAILGAIVNTFKISSWTLLFLRINSRKKTLSKVFRTTKNLIK